MSVLGKTSLLIELRLNDYSLLILQGIEKG